MKIGDKIYVRGYVDEIRKDTVIVRNEGGYFGTIPSEVITGELPSVQPEKRTKTHACDLIDRQAAISAICNACGKIDCDKMDKCEKLQLPPANCSEFPNSSDSISRQAAIEDVKSWAAVDGREKHLQKDVIEWLKEFPSARPEIIHCKECKYGVQDEDKRWFCRSLGCQVGEADGSGFCADAERRTDE